MQRFEDFGEWIRATYGSQVAAAPKIGVAQNTISQWASGKARPSPEMEKRLRKLGYTGTFGASKETPPPADDHITKEEFAEWRGYWRAGTEKVLERLEDLARRIEAIEKRL